MQEWVSLTESIAAWLGIDQDALRIFSALGICLLIALFTRRPLSSLIPLLAVLVLASAHEAAAALADGQFVPDELPRAGRDVALAMTVPIALFLLGRFAPSILAPRTDRRIFVPAVRDNVPAMRDKPARVVGAAFKDVA